MASDYPNSGALFKNDRKEKPTHADMRGQAEIDGVEYWLDAWTKPSRDGGKFLSISFKRKDGQQDARTAAPAQVAQPAAEDDSDLPF